MNPVHLVTISKKSPLYKKGEEASKIELINLEEFGYDLVSQKNLYQIGDKAIFIEPDYCLSNISLFESFIKPGGDESKSMLGKIEGKPRRIRAKSFNFSKNTSSEDKVYSYGILLPYNEVALYLENKYQKPFVSLDNIDLTSLLEITKYEEPEKTNGLKIGSSKPFPPGVYKTDEPNIFNKLGHLVFPVRLYGTLKIDGSSITFGIINRNTTICSRNMQKPLTYKKCIEIRKKTLLEKLMFWKKPCLKIYKEVENEDDFIKYAKPYVDKMINLQLDDILFRGELNGKHLKGSGNKNNPAIKEEPNIKVFGLDYIEKGIAKKCNKQELDHMALVVGIPTVPIIFDKEFNSFQEIIDECNSYFKDNLVEGIVVRTHDNSFSAKVMNLEYDSKK